MDREHRIGCHTGLLCSSQLVISLTRCATQTGPSIPYPNPQPPNFKKYNGKMRGSVVAWGAYGSEEGKKKKEKIGERNGHKAHFYTSPRPIFPLHPTQGIPTLHTPLQFHFSHPNSFLFFIRFRSGPESKQTLGRGRVDQDR